MSMSDCIKCWNATCSCGWEYAFWSRERRIELAAAILGIHPDAVKSLYVPEDHPQKAAHQAEDDAYKKRQIEILKDLTK